MNLMTGRPPTSSQRSQAKLVASGSKRKLHNGEELPGGLVIVRPTSSQGSRPISQPPPDPPPSSNPHRPPAKKFRADSQPPSSSKPPRVSSQPLAGPSSKLQKGTPEIEDDVRAMEDEADRLRREARARATLNPSLREEYHVPARPPNSSRKSARIVDTTQALPPANMESPLITKNKRLREDAMNGIRASSQEPEPAESGERGRGSSADGSARKHRRNSSVNGRGKRISQSFEATGILSHPHNSISPTSFFKHIDSEIPETERLRVLLSWCTSRSAGSYLTDPERSLPPLSAEEATALKKVQEGIQRQLADKTIDISTNPQSQSTGSRANEQNVSNRRYEKQYSEEIRRMEEEHETWKNVNYHYETHLKKEQARIDKRKSDISHRQSLSAKAKGKQKADVQEDWSWLPLEHILESQRPGFALAKAVLGLTLDPTGSIQRTTTTGIRIGREQAEAELSKEFSELPFNLDLLHTNVNAARATTAVAEAALDERFRLLSMALAARSGDVPNTTRTGTTSMFTQILGSYVPPAPSRRGNDSQNLFRALARVDSARPPAQIGDAARRAAREVHRMEESGTVGSSQRRLTEVPQTPKKAPGTPRRGTTPGRSNTPGR